MSSSGDDQPKKKKTRGASREHQPTRALARALVAEADAAEARANEKIMAKIAAFWKAEGIKALRRSWRVDAYAYAEDRKLQKQPCEIHSLTRAQLIKALRKLGSDQAGERASAALEAEKQRLLLGKTWNELVVRGLIKSDGLGEDDQDDVADDARPKTRMSPKNDDDLDDDDAYFVDDDPDDDIHVAYAYVGNGEEDDECPYADDDEAEDACTVIDVVIENEDDDAEPGV